MVCTSRHLILIQDTESWVHKTPVPLRGRSTTTTGTSPITGPNRDKLVIRREHKDLRLSWSMEDHYDPGTPLSLPATTTTACRSEVLKTSPTTPPSTTTQRLSVESNGGGGALKRVVSVEILSRKFSYISPVVVQNGTTASSGGKDPLESNFSQPDLDLSGAARPVLILKKTLTVRSDRVGAA
eukprot:sb/3471514/